MARPRFSTLRRRLASEHPELEDPDDLVTGGRVLVDGRFLTNPDAAIPMSASVVILPVSDLRGEAKLGYALDRCRVPVDGRIALDVGAAAGGFTKALLARGARKVFAVDAGHGQLLGSLRQHDQVVNLEATNVGDLTQALVPDVVDIVTIDVSYLSLRSAVAQLDGISLSRQAQLVGLVKPMFELGRGWLPEDEGSLAEAVQLAETGIAAAGWQVRASFRSMVTGSRGAVEFFVHATRLSSSDSASFAEVEPGP